MGESDPVALRRQRLLTILSMTVIAVLATCIWVGTLVPPADHFFALDARSPLTWIWRGAGLLTLAAVLLTIWVGTNRFGGSHRLVVRLIAVGIVAVLSGIAVGVLGVDRHGGPTPMAVDVAATALMVGGAVLAAIATLPLLAAAARR